MRERVKFGAIDSNPEIAGLLPESFEPTGEALIAEIREEQVNLRARQDHLDRLLEQQQQNRRKSDAEKKKGSDDDDDDDKNKDDKKEPKKPLPQRVREEFREHPVRSIGGTVLAIAAVTGGILFYLHTLTYEDTDDAQIDGNISAVSPRVNGTVAGVYFDDNQVVHAGDLLADIDPSDLQVALDQAQAQLAQAEAQLKSEEPNVPITTVTNKTNISTSSEDVATAQAELAEAERDAAQAKAQIAQAQANDRYAQVESQRMARLASMGAVAVSQSDQRTSTADATAATLEAQRQAANAAEKKVDQQRAKLASAYNRLEEARANAPEQLEAKEADVELRQAAVKAARAQLEQARLNRSYARIVAPVDGVVGNKSINVGDRVQPGQQITALTQTSNLWITANFRETQLQKMHPGQSVKMHVDALDLDFTGKVASLPGATGSRYSLLPPENATGNYVKVVQRLPVRIELDKNQKGYDRLRPGMSVEPKVSLK